MALLYASMFMLPFFGYAWSGTLGFILISRYFSKTQPNSLLTTSVTNCPWMYSVVRDVEFDRLVEGGRLVRLLLQVVGFDGSFEDSKDWQR